MMLIKVPELQAGWLINLAGLRPHDSQLRRPKFGVSFAVHSTMPLHSMQAARTLHAHCDPRPIAKDAAHHKRVSGHCVTSLHIPHPLQVWQLRHQRAQEAQCRKQEGIQAPYVSSLQSLLRTWRHMWEVSAHSQPFTSHPPPRAAKLTQALLLSCVYISRAPCYVCERHACSLQASLTHAYLLPMPDV